MLELYVNDGNPNPESNQPTNHATSFILVLSSVYHFYCIQYLSLSILQYLSLPRPSHDANVKRL